MGYQVGSCRQNTRWAHYIQDLSCTAGGTILSVTQPVSRWTGSGRFPAVHRLAAACRSSLCAERSQRRLTDDHDRHSTCVSWSQDPPDPPALRWQMDRQHQRPDLPHHQPRHRGDRRCRRRTDNLPHQGRQAVAPDASLGPPRNRLLPFWFQFRQGRQNRCDLRYLPVSISSAAAAFRSLTNSSTATPCSLAAWRSVTRRASVRRSSGFFSGVKPWR